MKAIIITIGDEILMGQILDTNSQYIARSLTDMGVEITEILSIPDKRDEIYETVEYAMSEADLIIVTGGLGPTKDDVTKKVLAEYFGSQLKMNEEVFARLEEMLKRRGLTMNEGNRSQALLPDNCRILRNDKGTASGMWFEKGWKSLISLPGVPFEMEHLIDTSVMPELAQMLENWEDALKEGLKLAYLPSPGLVRLRITAKGESVKHLDECYESLKEVLKDVRYAEGDDVLEKQLGELLRNKKVTMATAESCTGGYIAHLITSIAGSSDYFKGSVVSYANEVKVNVLGVNAADLEREGAVSEAVVLQMAEGVRKITGADYAVSTSGVAGPGGGTPEKPVGTVWIGVATPRKSYAKLFTFSFTRERNIAKAASKAMEMLLEEVRENEK